MRRRHGGQARWRTRVTGATAANESEPLWGGEPCSQAATRQWQSGGGGERAVASVGRRTEAGVKVLLWWWVRRMLQRAGQHTGGVSRFKQKARAPTRARYSRQAHAWGHRQLRLPNGACGWGGFGQLGPPPWVRSVQRAHVTGCCSKGGARSATNSGWGRLTFFHPGGIVPWPLVWILKAAAAHFKRAPWRPPLGRQFTRVRPVGGHCSRNRLHANICKMSAGSMQKKDNKKKGISTPLAATPTIPGSRGPPARAGDYPPKAQRTPNSTAVGTTLRTTNGARPSSQPSPPPAPPSAPPPRLAMARVRSPTSG